ncbi:peptidoglycan-binding protein, partial [Burkholderia multivorans]
MLVGALIGLGAAVAALAIGAVVILNSP